jgi:hypothetical protein
MYTVWIAGVDMTGARDERTVAGAC